MKFKKLEVAGFKSFADRLEIKFGAGVTAIVGPNGCGKSNVADAIRWVLGEQSAKLLRGSTMQDVIFSGTENRKSLSYCEVNLYFDNTGKQLFPSLDYDEVVISRKLYRNGDSEYSLNRTQCRLKNITDILRDGGMGREGYSIIGQGRIEELLRAKPEDRRAIFEEAAGISKHKARKIDTERKLARVRENLVRIEDILREKSALMEPLSKQAEAARKWLELRERLKIHEINIYIRRYETANQAKAVIQERMDAITKEIELRQKECDEATATYNAAMESLGDIDKSINRLRDELLTLTVGLEKTAGDIKLLQQRLEYLTSQTEQLKAEHSQLSEDYKETENFIEQGKNIIAQTEAEFSAAQAEAEKLHAEYIEVVELLTQGEGEVESNHRAVVEAMSRLADIRANMSRLVAEREGLNRQCVDLEARIRACNERISVDNAQVERLRGEIETFVAEKGTIDAQLDALYEKNNECIADINSAAVEIDKVSKKYYSAKTGHKMLLDMKESYDGFAYSVKRLLSDAKTNATLASHFEGMVASLLTVNDGFETAIETALGNAMQNIVTRNEEDAQYLIEYLKTTKSGRATFLPMTSVKSRSLEPEYRRYLSERGVVGIAIDLVTFDSKYATVFSGLLGNTVVVDNMDNAIALARKSRYGFRIVTKDGELLTPHGSLTGGSKKSEYANIFGHEKQIEELAASLATLDKELASLNAVRDERAAEQKTVSGQILEKNEIKHKLEVEIATRSEVMNKLISSVTQAQDELVGLEEARNNARSRIESITRDVDSVYEHERKERDKKDSANESGEEQRQQFDALRKQRDQLHEKETAARVKATALEQQIKAATSDLTRIQASLESLSAKMEYDVKQIAENELFIAKIDAEIREEVHRSNSTDSTRVKEIRNTLSDLDGYKAEVQMRITAFDTKRMELVSKLQQLHEKKNREEMQLLKVDSDIEQMQEKVQSDYELEYSDCLPFRQEDYDLNKGLIEANRITRQMNALGNINLNAIEQSQELYKSYHEQEVQKNDCLKAEADMMKIIADTSKEMIAQFNEQFELIRQNFVKIFKELFDGGTADLLLLENEDPLDAGIEIVAQPPQKRLQSISLLSGGERALTAIAILFAILRLKPMPFCVLDEIEAALDDANAGRFAKYLRRFSEETQFIVITHRKPTMELADNLYGVTMEEKGVSKIVSVKLSEAIAMEDKA